MRSRYLLKVTVAILMTLGVSQGCLANPASTPIPSIAPTAAVILPPTRTLAPTTAIPSTADDIATLHAVETASIKP